MKLALVQLQVLEKNKAGNVAHGLELLRQAAKEHDIVVLPEVWPTGYSLGHLQQEAETFDSSLIKDICQIAKENECSILAGSIPMSHDVANGVGYLIHDGKESLLYLTDTGYVKKDIIPLICNCNHYIIEANHNVELLMHGRYPSWLKQRILSDKGHLSNEQCANYLKEIASSKLEKVVLAHLSEECNKPEVAYQVTSCALEELNLHPTILIAKQDEAVEVIND